MKIPLLDISINSVEELPFLLHSFLFCITLHLFILLVSCVYARYSTYVEDRGQFVGVNPLLLPCRLCRRNSGQEAYQRAPLPPELSLWPCFNFVMVAILTSVRWHLCKVYICISMIICVGCVFLCLLAVGKLSFINVYSDHLPIKRNQTFYTHTHGLSS